MHDFEEIIQKLGPDTKQFENSNVAITGSNGLLGRYLSGSFIQMNNKCLVYGIDNGTFDKKKIVKSKYMKYFWKDISKDRINYDVDYLFNCFGIASPVHYKSREIPILEASYHGTKNAMEWARKRDMKGVVVFSSSEVYSTPDVIPTPETYVGRVNTMGPRSAYDIGKLVVETTSYLYWKNYGIPVTIVRPHNIYGLHMRIDDGRAVPNIVFKSLKFQPITIHGNGLQSRTFCYATDATTGFIQVCLHGKRGEAYNIGTESPEISMVDLTKEIGKVIGKELRVEFVQDKDVYKIQPQRRAPNVSKAVKDIGYAPSVTIQEGLQRFIDWAKTVI